VTTGNAASTTYPSVINIATSGTSGNTAYLAGNASQYSSSNTPDFQTLVRTTNTITNLTIWAGLSSGTDALGGTSNPTQYMAAFRFDTSDSDTKWECVYNNDGTATAVASSTTVTANTIYKLEVIIGSSTLDFKINGAQACGGPISFTMTANELLGYEDSVTESTTTAESVSLGWVYIDSAF